MSLLMCSAVPSGLQRFQRLHLLDAAGVPEVVFVLVVAAYLLQELRARVPGRMCVRVRATTKIY